MAMLKNEHITLSVILVCLIVVFPIVKAQLGLLGGGVGGQDHLGFGGFVSGITGRGGSGGLLNIPNILGVLFCTPNGNLSRNTASTPAFPNAGIQLWCGRQNTVVSSTTTNAAGIFSIPTNSIHMLLSTLLSDCKLAVTTPLTNCNATLPSVGNLVSPLTVIGTTRDGGVLNVINLAPTGFLHTA